MGILMGVIDIVMFTISLSLELEYPTTKSNLYIFGGTAVSTLYILGIFVLLVMLVGIITRAQEMAKQLRYPIYFCIMGLVIIVTIQIIGDYNYNALSFLYSLIVTTLYFTIESQDYKLVDDLEKKRVEAQIADRNQREFLANMSHEIRTPLNTILGFSNSLTEEEHINKEVIDRDVSMIHDASTTLLELINNILDISRIESGKEQVDEKEYKLDNLVFDINSVILAKIDKKVLDFKINVNNTIPSGYYGDYIKIYKILLCILNNALKYSNYGHVSLDIDGTKIDDEYFEFKFTVANEGHAMTTENFEVDFNDFVKIESGYNNVVDSTALGLILAKKLIEMLEGKIEFANKKGEGTKYFVTLKQKINNNNPVGDLYLEDHKNKELFHIDCTGKKVLIVDDNNLNIKLGSKLLQAYNFDIDSATSGKECIEKVEKNKYDIIFLDHMMPEMDGIVTLKELKKISSNIPPVIALTANSYTGIKEKYIEEGFNDFLAKPISVKELNRIIYEVFKDNM